MFKLIVMYYFIFINMFSFVIYYIDKRKAIKHKYRIPEKMLLLSSLVGGCLGSLLSMHLFHHKTKHLKFELLVPLFCLIWITIILLIN